MRALEEWLKLYVHPTGVRLFVARETEKAALELGDAEVARWAAEVVAAETITQQLELEWSGQKGQNPNAREDARETDKQLDAALSALYSSLKLSFERLPKDHPHQLKAATILQDVFPMGIQPVTTMVFEQEHSAIDAIIHRLQNKHTLDITALGATVFLEQLVECHTKYGIALSILNQKKLSYDHVKATRAASNRLYIRLILRILARYSEDDHATNTARHKLLKTIEDQEARIAMRNRRHSRKKASPDNSDNNNDPSPNGTSVPTSNDS